MFLLFVVMTRIMAGGIGDVDRRGYEALQGSKRQEKLHKKLSKYMLRRRKDNTIKAQMPKKIDNIVFCELSELQLKAYRQARTHHQQTWDF